jgi:hypothetical protein
MGRIECYQRGSVPQTPILDDDSTRLTNLVNKT